MIRISKNYKLGKNMRPLHWIMMKFIDRITNGTNKTCRISLGSGHDIRTEDH